MDAGRTEAVAISGNLPGRDLTASRYELTPLLDVYDAAGTDDDDDGMLVSIRCLALKQVGLVHRAWTKAELVPYYERVRAMLRDAMVEPNLFLRMAARAAFCHFCDTWYGSLSTSTSSSRM